MGVEYPMECMQKSVLFRDGTSAMGVEHSMECMQKSVLFRGGLC